MKPSYLYILFALFLVTLAIVSCNTSKEAVKEKMTMIVLLQKKEKRTYIEKTYANYQPANVKRSNRTLNQYRVQFSCTKAEAKTLMQQMETDPKVVEFSVSPTNSTK